MPSEFKGLKFTPFAHTLSGLDYLDEQKYPEAMRELEAAHDMAPDYALTNFLLGLTYTHLNKFYDAEQSLERAGKLAPESASEVEAASYLLNEGRKEAARIAANPNYDYQSPPPGIYTCTYTYATLMQTTRSEAKGYFALETDGTYQWLGKGPVYNYSYDWKSKEIKFISGPLAEPLTVATLRTSGTSPYIIITFQTAETLAKKALPMQWLCTWSEKAAP
jgi:tetratricopeptide (TPR) repeat protein